MNAEISFIGRIRSELLKREDCPLQGTENAPSAMLEFFDPFSIGMKNVKEGDEIILLTWLHQADRNVLECYKRKDVHGEKFGVFSTRSPDRPNPIGLHPVTVVKRVDEKTFQVRPLEVLDGTPVVDVKPMI